MTSRGLQIMGQDNGEKQNKALSVSAPNFFPRLFQTELGKNQFGRVARRHHLIIISTVHSLKRIQLTTC